jgi:hypothetical protein
LGATIRVGLNFQEAGKTKISNFTDEAILISLLHQNILEFKVPMYNFIAVDDFNSPEYLAEDVKCLLEGEDFVRELALDRVKITHVAILHHEKIPVALCVIEKVPSKVL